MATRTSSRPGPRRAGARPSCSAPTPNSTKDENARLQGMLAKQARALRAVLPTTLIAGTVAFVPCGGLDMHGDFVTRAWQPDPLKTRAGPDSRLSPRFVLRRAHERSPAPGTSGHLRRPRHAPLRLERDQPAAACAAGRGPRRGRRRAARDRARLAAARCRPHDPSARRGSRPRAASTTCTRNSAPSGWPSASAPRSASRSACMSPPSAISAPSSRTISASSRPTRCAASSCRAA